jgi:hypothetical protein
MGEGCRGDLGLKPELHWHVTYPCPATHLIRVHSCPFVVQKHRLHSYPFVSIRGSKRRSIRAHSWFKTPPPFVSIRGSKHRLHSCTFVSIRGSKHRLHSCTFVSIRGSKHRLHSYSFVSIRGSKHRLLFVHFRVFRGPTPPTTSPLRFIRENPCSSVAKKTPLIRLIRGSETPPPFVSIRVHSWFKTPPPFVHIRVHSWFKRRLHSWFKTPPHPWPPLPCL